MMLCDGYSYDDSDDDDNDVNNNLFKDSQQTYNSSLTYSGFGSRYPLSNTFGNLNGLIPGYGSAPAKQGYLNRHFTCTCALSGMREPTALPYISDIPKLE